MTNNDPIPPFWRRMMPLWAVALVALLVLLLAFWLSSSRPGRPELTRAERKHLERQSTALGTAARTHYETAQTLLHEPIIPGDSLARLAAFDSTIATW